MKKILIASAASAVLVLTGSCSKKEEKPLTTGKTLIYCSEGSPSSFNPQLTEDGTSVNAQNPIYNRLVAIERGKTTIIPDLAERWEISKDQKSYTFYLRKDVQFHKTDYFTPTRGLNADDVLFSILRQLDKNHPFHKVGGGHYIFFESMGMDMISKLEKLDDHTVRFTLKKPDSTFLANISMEFASILSAEYADAMAKAGTPDMVDVKPIGTGPFIFKSYEKDSIIQYIANPEYYGPIKAMVDRLVFVITPDPNVRAQKIKAGECDIIAEPALTDLAGFEKNSAIKIDSTTGLNIAYLGFNTKKKPFDSILVRKAIFHAMNRAAYIEAIYQGMAEVSESPLPPSGWGYNSNLPVYNYDIEKAKSLLKEAGYPNGFSTSIWAFPITRPYNPDGRKMAEMMQADLAKVGIEAKIITYDWPTYLTKSRSGEHNMILFGWISDNGDPDNFLYTQLSCDGVKASMNRAFWCYQPFDELIIAAKRSANMAERTELYMDAQKVFKEQVPWVTVASAKIFRVMKSNVKGFVLDPLGRDFLDGVSP